VLKKLNITPFSDFWTFCHLSDLLSVLISKYPRFYEYAILNAYSYSFRGSHWWWRDIDIAWDNKYLSYIYDCFTFEKIMLDSKNIIDNIIDVINNDDPMLIPVDVFYLPNRIDWKKKHLSHNIMVTGYDTKEGMLFYFIDTFSGYEECSISYNTFKEAIFSVNEKPVAHLLSVKDNLLSSNISIDSVYDYAQNLRENLSKFSYMSSWINNETSEDSLLGTIIIITKFIERQKANAALIKFMAEKGLLANIDYRHLLDLIAILENDWGIIRAIFIKANTKRETPNFDRLNLLAHKCFILEWQLWCKILKPISYSKKYKKDKEVYNALKIRDRENEIILKNVDYTLVKKLFHGKRYLWTKITLSYGNVSDSLMVTNSNGFSVSTCGETDTIYEVQVKRNKINLITDIHYFDVNEMNSIKVSYNGESGISDSKGNLIPHMDMIPIEDYCKISPFLNKLSVSDPLQVPQTVEDLKIDILSEYAIYKNCAFTENICSISKIYDKDYAQNKIVLFKFRFDCFTMMKLSLRLGHSGTVKVWQNNSSIYISKKKKSYVQIDDSVISFTGSEGVNEMIIAMDVCFNKKYPDALIGIMLRIENVDDNYSSQILPMII